MLARGSDTTNAPKVADLFAISLAVTIIAPLKRPFPTRLTQLMRREGRSGLSRMPIVTRGYVQQPEQDRDQEQELHRVLPLGPALIQGVVVRVVPDTVPVSVIPLTHIQGKRVLVLAIPVPIRVLPLRAILGEEVGVVTYPVAIGV